MSDFIIEDGVLKKYTGPGGDVVIPKGVTEIGRESFAGCQSLRSVTIPEGVTSIGVGAFSDCSALSNVTIPESVTEIGYQAFCGCACLTSMTIPKGVTRIGDGMFSGCTDLVDVNIPGGVTVIGNAVFDGCSSLSGVTIPEGVTSIGGGAFRGCTALVSVVIPKGVKEINRETFQRCTSLAKVTIPTGVTTIGDRAFVDCAALTDVTIPEGVAKLGEGVFYGCNALVSVTIPASVISIGDGAFSGCTNLTDVTYLGTDEQLGAIGIGAGNEALCGILLKDGRKPSGSCGGTVTWRLTADGVLTIGGTGKMTRAPWLNYGVQIRTVIVGSGVEALLMDDHPILPGSIWAYMGNQSMERFSVEEGSKHYASIDGVLFNKKVTRLEAFPPARKIKCYCVPEGVKTIRASAFQYSHVQLVQLPRTVEKVAKDTFEDIYVSTYSPEAAAKLDCPIFLGDVEDLPPKVKNRAVQGFLYALAHDMKEIEPWTDSYADYIKRNSKTYVKQAAKDKKLLRLMLEKKLLSDSDVKTLLKGVKGAEMTAALLNYQQEQFGGKKRKEEFSLDDSDPAMKRTMKMTQRREQIKDQKGIAGLNFVATGEMEHFGSYDEYTGAHDFDDLKWYIEERGGHLRSAVSSRTDYLICNDPASTTVKSKKAAELSVPVIAEAQFLQMAEGK